MQGGERQGSVREGVTRRLPEIYLAVALTVCSLLCVLTPPAFSPDEAAHAERALQVGRGQWMAALGRPPGDARGVVAGGVMDAALAEFLQRFIEIESALGARHPEVHERGDARVSAAEMQAARGARWSPQRVYVGFPNTAVYPPLLYLPQALGWRVGQAAGMTLLHSLWLARLLAAWSAAACGWLALRLAGQQRWLLFAYLLLPTLLAQSSSCSQDALLLPLAALALALVARALEARRGLSRGELAAATALLAICVSARPPYLALALVLLLPALECDEAGWRRLWPPLAGVLAVVAAMAAWMLAVRHLGTNAAPWADPALQAAFVRAHPLRAAAVLVGSTLRQAPGLAVKFLYMLGVGDVFPPRAVYALYVAALAVVAWLAPRLGLRRWASRGVLLLALLGVVAAISLAEFLIWTPVGGHALLGLGARYYFPLLPFALLLCRERTTQSGGGRWLLVASAWLVAAVLYAPWLAAERFHGLGLGAALRLLAG